VCLLPNAANKIDFQFQAVLIKFVGTHAEYDKIDSETVDHY
jgi:mRNA-degrading endonuclease HigB of HigAB toxin-antitoxin module